LVGNQITHVISGRVAWRRAILIMLVLVTQYNLSRLCVRDFRSARLVALRSYSIGCKWFGAVSEYSGTRAIYLSYVNVVVGSTRTEVVWDLQRRCELKRFGLESAG
jgi:hypothetical protein